MNDLDDLKAALHEPPDFTPRPLDLNAVLTTGGRMRRRRRLAVGATSGIAVIALLVGGNVLAQRITPDGASGEPAAVQPASGPDIVWTGLRENDAEWTLYIRPIADEAIPQTTFGVVLGKSIAGGRPVDTVISNETSGSDRSPGFHAVQGGMGVDASRTPTFGYYAGPAVRITAKVGGRTVTVPQAPLTDGIEVFWYDAETLSNLAAYDSAGERLPDGNREVGVG